MRWSRERRLLTRGLVAPRGVGPRTAPLARDAMDLPSHQARHCRHRFRTTTTGQTRTPSVGSPRTLRSEWLGCACCSLASPRPAPFRSHRARSTSSRVEGSPRATSHASRWPCGCHVAPGEDALHRLLQPTLVTSTLRIARFLGAYRAAPRLATPRDSLRRLTLGRSPAAARHGSPPFRLPNEPTKWSLA